MSESKGCCTPGRDSLAGKKDNAASSCCGGEGCLPETPAKVATTTGMVKLDGGKFLMGSESDQIWPADGEGPVREVTIDPFWIDRTTVTNDQFAEFIRETGYVTEAQTFGWSYVFHILVSAKLQARLHPPNVPGLEWWYGVPGATWDHPEGPGSHLKRRGDHPAVHVSWHDAEAYARWAGKRLLTEAEWEYAARGGLVQKDFPWGAELTPEGKHHCNIWQGKFPYKNSAEDGYISTAPARSFKANGFGIYNMSGNVWEWVGDWFSTTYHLNGPRVNPTGPSEGERRGMKGGSYLCHHSYCNRYRLSARTGNTPDSSMGNCGFRCAVSV